MEENKIKVIFVLPSLRAGGAERVISFIADNINPDRFDTSLVIIESDKDKSYTLKNVSPIYLNKNRSREALFGLFLHIRQRKPDIVVGSIGQVNLMLSFYRFFIKSTKFVARETSAKRKRKLKRISLAYALEKIQIKNVHKVICQSKDMYNNMLRRGYVKDKLVIIHNPITQNAESKSKSTFNKDNLVPHFITIGRLEKTKGYDRIIAVLSKFKAPFFYTIIGSGRLQSEIFVQIDEAGLSERVKHIPFTKDVLHHLSESDVYLQGSYSEGFPNALLESCSVGTPVLAYTAPGGTSEIIRDGVNGYIVGSEIEFLNKLNELVRNKPDPRAVSHSVTSRFSSEIILQQYERLFLKTVNDKSPSLNEYESGT